MSNENTYMPAERNQRTISNQAISQVHNKGAIKPRRSWWLDMISEERKTLVGIRADKMRPKSKTEPGGKWMRLSDLVYPFKRLTV